MIHQSLIPPTFGRPTLPHLNATKVFAAAEILSDSDAPSPLRAEFNEIQMISDTHSTQSNVQCNRDDEQMHGAEEY